MVTFKNMGRLGNFLFEAATAFAYAKRHELEFTVPVKTNDRYWNPLYLQHLAKPIPALPTIAIRETRHNYQDLPFHPSWKNKNIILEGYWQTEKYFKEYRSEILEAFAFPWNPHNNVSIHVRRGDYLKYPDKHPIVPDSFYQHAIKYFVLLGYRDFHVYSDDIPWCENYFNNLYMGIVKDVRFVFHSGGNEVEDLIGISNCAGGHINSSSTFSWWSAWLNRNPQKVVITPKLWFTPGHGGLDTSDIIPETWVKI
jgi:hypothetical protein